STLLLSLQLLICGGLFLWSGRLVALPLGRGPTAIRPTPPTLIAAEPHAPRPADPAGHTAAKQRELAPYRWRSVSGRCSVAPRATPAGRMVTLATGSACSHSAAVRACP
ncbi:hypothetical protein VM98_37100, partial [Streptomyces rubellomurinus subsp. indigoferus]